MRLFNLLFTCFLLYSFTANAQWTNRYPKVVGFGHHVYLEGYELPILNTGPIDPAPSTTTNQVVFSAKGYLWVMDMNTSTAKRITFSSGIDSSPNWSPDGTKIVFTRDTSLDIDIMMLDVNTMKESVLVSTEALDLNPIFSASGNDVYYASAIQGSFDLWKINLSTLERTNFTTEDSLERLPIPTQNETEIVYLKKYDFSYDSIELLDLESKTSTPLIEENFTSQAAFSLSPNNSTLVYTWPNGDNYELHLLNINIPKSKVLLTKSNGLPLSPKFSADGEWVYYTENNSNEVSELKRISVNGGASENLSVKTWDWGTPTGKLKITSKVDGKTEAVRMSIIDENGHPIIPNSGKIHSEGQHGIVFFYSPGDIEIEAPIGNLTITAVHGFTTTTVVQEINIKEGLNSTDINLNRIWDAKKEGWYSADTHFHLNYGGTSQLDPEDILVDLKAEDIDFGFPLVANLGNRFLGQDIFGWQNDELPILQFGQEVRSHFLGHLNLLGTKELYWPWVWGPYYDIYNTDDRLNAEPLRFTRKQGGVGGYVHPVSIKDPFAEGGARRVPIGLVADAIMEEVDMLEIGCLWTDEIGTAAVWHEFLNLGIPMALSAGSDVMNDLYRTMAIGAARVYVKPEGEPTFENYLKALKAGRSFVSTGPQVVFSVGDAEVGDVIKSKTKSAKWTLDVHSAVPYDQVEIFVNGIVVDTQKRKQGTNVTYSGSIDLPAGGWVTARVLGSQSVWPSMDSYSFAESAPIWFNAIGSTMPASKVSAANKLLKILDVSEQRLNAGYGTSKIPKLRAHFAQARERLNNIINGN